MIPVQLVDCKLDIKTLIAFFDSGSNINMVRDRWVEAARLEGVPIEKVVQTAGGDCRHWNTKMYSIPFVKNNGEVVQVVAMGVGKIMEGLEFIDHLLGMDLFPTIDSWRLRRPCGEMDLLVGIGMAEIFSYLQDEKLH